MSYIAAECTIVLGGVTLLELGVDQMREESSFSQSRLVQMVAPLRADYQKGIPRGNARHSFSWSRVKPFATGLAARLFKFTHAAELPKVAGDCTLTYGDGTVITMANALLIADAYTATTHAQLFYASYRISAGALTITPPTSP